MPWKDPQKCLPDQSVSFSLCTRPGHAHHEIVSAWVPRHYILLLMQTPIWGVLLAHDLTQRALERAGLPWVGPLGASQLILSTIIMLWIRPGTWRGALATHTASLILCFLLAQLVD